MNHLDHIIQMDKDDKVLQYRSVLEELETLVVMMLKDYSKWLENKLTGWEAGMFIRGELDAFKTIIDEKLEKVQFYVKLSKHYSDLLDFFEEPHAMFDTQHLAEITNESWHMYNIAQLLWANKYPYSRGLVERLYDGCTDFAKEHSNSTPITEEIMELNKDLSEEYLIDEQDREAWKQKKAWAEKIERGEDPEYPE